jgi:CHAT domain-containing protein
MASQELIQQLLELPDVEAQKRFLEEHACLLDDQVAWALKEQADQFLRADLHRALQAAELLLHLAGLTGNPLHRALGLLAEAHARSFGGLGQYEQAVALLDEAATIYRAHDRPVDEARAQIGKIWSLAQLGRYDEAMETGQWASRVLEENAEWLLLAKLTANLGVIHRRLREDAKALALYDQARDLYNRLGAAGEPLKALARLEQNRSTVLRNLGQFEASIQASQSAWEMLTRLGQSAEAARAQQNLAVTYFVLGRYNEALELLDQARDFFLADGRLRDAILVELFVSDCLLQLGRFSDVLDKCAQIRGLFTELGARLEVAQAILNEAVAYAGLRRYIEALASLDEARRMFEEEGNSVWVACTDLETVAVLSHQGQFEESLAAAQACAKVFRGHDLPIEEARAHLIAARAAEALNRYALAHRLVTETLAVGESRDIPVLTYQCHHLLGSMAQAQGNVQAALAEYDRAIEELERLRGRLMVEFRADFLEDKQVIYEDMVCLCLDLDQPCQGLEYAERAKSRALLDLLAYRLDLSIETRGAEDSHLVGELMRLRARRDQLYRRWEAHDDLKVGDGTPSNRRQQQVQQNVLALEKRITELWHRLLIHNADYARDASLWQVRTEPVQPYLAPDTLLLEYFIAHQELVVFLVTASAVHVRRLPIDLARVERLVRLLWLNLKAVPRSTSSQTSKLASNARGLLRQLYELLIAPLGDGLVRYLQLIIVPHGPLHYLPFHALCDGRSYLLERHEISYLPGASLLRYCCEAQPAASDLLAFGHSYDGRLRYTVQEARSIAELSGGQAFLEEEATVARLREAGADCRALHLAAHGDFRPDNPLFSGLALADGWLTTLDIFNLRFNASLVTLSACQTGRSVVGGGDELLGLMRAFLYAGTTSLVLSLWAVEDRSTARLMETFYRKLAQGWRKGAALRHAQLQLIEGQSSDDHAAAEVYSHPYFWAPFFLVGDAGPL